MVITEIDEFEALAQWLESNLRGAHRRCVENVSFGHIEWHDDLTTRLSAHRKGLMGRVPISGDDLGGFYAMLYLDQVSTVMNFYDPTTYGDIFAGSDIPIHQVNQSYQNGGGRLVMNSEKIIGEATTRFAYRVFMFSSDWPALSDSFRVRALLMGK